jgi:hypothetical protein
MSSFVPRKFFSYPSLTPSWYAGHMAASLRRLPEVLEDIDLVIEARDARLPITSINTAFDSVLEHAWGPVDARGRSSHANRKGKGKDTEGDDSADLRERIRDRLIVYTKRDLAEEIYEKVSWSASLGLSSAVLC